jgi:hypothetical protein
MKRKVLATNWLLGAGMIAVVMQLVIIGSVSQIEHFNWLGSRPISDLDIPKVAVDFSLGFFVAALFLVGYIVALGRKYRLSRRFVRALGTGIACVVVTGIIPDKRAAHLPLSSLWVLHWLAASLLLLSMALSLQWFLDTPQLPSSVRAVTRRFFLIYIALLVPEVALMGAHILYAASEATSLLIFDGWIIYTILAPA